MISLCLCVAGSTPASARPPSALPRALFSLSVRPRGPGRALWSYPRHWPAPCFAFEISRYSVRHFWMYICLAISFILQFRPVESTQLASWGFVLSVVATLSSAGFPFTATSLLQPKLAVACRLLLRWWTILFSAFPAPGGFFVKPIFAGVFPLRFQECEQNFNDF